ncbi:unnamed protein product [Bathycoccus prasinos]
MEKFPHKMTDAMARGSAKLADPSSTRTLKKRNHISALQKRDLREKLEREIKNVIAKPSMERTREEAKLLEMHEGKVSQLLARMEKSVHRKRSREEHAEEKEDSKREIDDAVAVVMKLLREDAGSRFVLHTGAGVSTSAKIPDFRGANGVWTKQRKGESVSMPKFENTKPTKAHMACKALYDAKVLTKIVTQNVDGLHQRAGVPEDAIAELHGSVYKERCSSCERIYTRDFDVTSTKPSHGKNRHRTGRMCEVDKCDGYLKDTIVQFGESLDEETLEKAREWSREAKMSVVVGSSLRVPPASTLPRMAKKHCVVVNLQWTSQDAKATLKLHAKADDILVKMCKHLGLKIPEYDPLTESVGRKVKERGEIFACEVKETAWNEKGMAMRDIDEKLKEATTGMDSGVGKTNARILFGEADGGKKLSKTAREALIRDEKRLKEEREGKVNATKTTTRKRKSKSLTMKPRSKMPCFPRPGSKQTPLTNTSPPLFDASKIVKKKRTPLKKRRSMVTKKEEQKMDKEERMKPKVATAVPIVVKTEQVAVLPPSDEDIARMLFAEINGMRRRR